MDLLEAAELLHQGKRIRRPHWATGTALLEENWNDIKVVILVPGFPEFYSFPFADVIARDWELYPAEDK